MNIWLDDMDHEQRPIPEGFVHLKTIDEVKAALLAHNVQNLSLDHDLGACDDCIQKAMVCLRCGLREAGKVKGELAKAKTPVEIWVCQNCWSTDLEEDWNGVMRHCEHFGTGYDLCLWMADKGVWPAKKPTVHSMNPVGRDRMIGVINRYFPEASDGNEG